MKYRITEINPMGEQTIKCHGHFKELEDAQGYARTHYSNNRLLTYIVSYKNEDGSLSEQFYGTWRAE